MNFGRAVKVSRKSELGCYTIPEWEWHMLKTRLAQEGDGRLNLCYLRRLQISIHEEVLEVCEQQGHAM